MVTRFWVSWWSNFRYMSQHFERVPFQVWVSGQREDGMVSYCAVIDAEDEDAVWRAVYELYDDVEERFCDPQEPDFAPGDRFQDFENRTGLE